MPSLRSRIIQRIMRDLKDALLVGIPLEERRRRFDAAAHRAIRIPRDVSVHAISAGGVPADWLAPDNSESTHAILYLHGGAYTIGSPTTHRGLAGRIASAARTPLLLINYHLAPEYPFPAALDDSLAAFIWLQKTLSSSHIYIGGDSAGGGLALATALALRDRGQTIPAAIFLISPWTDVTFSGDSIHARARRDPLLNMHTEEWQVNEYAGEYPLTHPYISPLFADLHGLPPCLIQVGSEEILFDDSYRLAARMDAVGVENLLEIWDGMWHVFQGFAPYVPEAQIAIDRIGTFIIEKTRRIA